MAATPSTRLESDARDALLRTAAIAIEAGLGNTTTRPPDPAHAPRPLDEPRASFVTLTIEQALRGCCGTLEPARPLLLDVWHNAQASAFRDARFPPLTAREWRRSRLEVSVLTPCERIVVADEQELLRTLVPGRDGLVLAWRGRRATFLPKVWEQVAGAQEFVARLKHKAGWAAGFWAADMEAWRYETESVAVDDPAELASAAPNG
jgi:AmmeMemoRadiSam system protein A